MLARAQMLSVVLGPQPQSRYDAPSRAPEVASARCARGCCLREVQPLSESPAPAPRAAAWREDPLSVFFALCVVVLAMMSVTDWWQQRALDAGQARAQAAPLGALNRAQCVADSAGYGGDTLVLRCTDASAAQIIDALRARSRTERASESVPEDSGTPDHVNDLTDRIVVGQALASLGDPRATILREVFMHDKTHQETAEKLGLPLGTVKSHVRRGLAAMRDILEEVDHVPVG